VAADPLRKAHADGRRLQEAIDTEYRAARRDATWGRTEPQMIERWRLAIRAWTQAAEAALGPEEARLGRFRSAPATAAPAAAGESAAWLEVRNGLAGKVAAVGKLIDERGAGCSGAGGAAPPPSPFRKR
jgi:hypothetical protein